MVATTVAAAGLPDYYPLQMPNTGRIDRIGDGQIVINDSLFRMADRLVIHSPEAEFASRAELEGGGADRLPFPIYRLGIPAHYRDLALARREA